MKKWLIILLFASSADICSQEKVSFLTPPPSPMASFMQQIVNGELAVTYSRPLARGRKIFGSLVPYDSLWRTGASGATTLHLTEELLIGEKLLPEGKYALFTIPGIKEWTVIINTDTSLHGTTGYTSTKDVHRFSVNPEKSGHYAEAFTISFTGLTNKGSGFLTLEWENTVVRVPVRSPVDDKVMAAINTRLIAGREKDKDLYYQAANYYYTTGRDLTMAASWVAEAEKMDSENFNYPNLLQKILADQGDYKAAITAVKRAIVIGEKKNMMSAVAALKKRLAEWERQ
jgi:tetratricopeptide (TPR) repeat protein